MPPKKVKLTEAEWRERLDPDAYHVARQAGTERPFTGTFWNESPPGTYHCVGCGTKLFTSDAKFVSMCGWPAFDAESDDAGIERHVDTSHGMRRVEVRCGVCDAHLGHVFQDGPTETGERYCINSVVLTHRPPDDRGPGDP